VSSGAIPTSLERRHGVFSATTIIGGSTAVVSFSATSTFGASADGRAPRPQHAAPG